MMLKPEDIAALLRLEGSGSDGVYDAAHPSEGVRRLRRTDMLAQVRETCEDELNKGAYEHLEALAKVLGDGVRDGESRARNWMVVKG